MIVTCGVTLYHACVDQESRMERYEKTYFPKASVYQQVSMKHRRNKNGPWAQWDTVIRIPVCEEIALAVGDRLIFGSSAGDIPPEKSLQVCEFADNRRGSKKVQHWKVVCQ